MVFTREHKATTSKDKSNIYIDINEQQMFKDFYTKDKDTTKTKTKTEDKNKATTKTKTKTDDNNKATTKTKTKTEDKNKTTLKTKTKTKAKNMTKTEDKKIVDKINNKVDAINKLNEGLAKIKADVTKKVEFIYESMCELQDEIYSDDSWLRLVELDKIDAIIEEAFNIVWKVLYKNKNIINPEKIMIDKHKDINGYVSKLTDVINNKTELVNRMCREIDHVMSEIKNETNMIDEKIHKVSEMDNDTLHLINGKLKEIMNQSRKNLSKIVV